MKISQLLRGSGRLWIVGKNIYFRLKAKYKEIRDLSSPMLDTLSLFGHNLSVRWHKRDRYMLRISFDKVGQTSYKRKVKI